MSRSRRKTPITGITNAASDRHFKDVEHRRERRAVRRAVQSLDDDDTPVPAPRLFGNPWASGKDGKRWHRSPRPELMRK